jgi:arylsulfatase A-like enzyme
MLPRLALLLLALALSAHAAPPNFLFILVDDMGATDLGCTGSKFYETPNLDRLAKEGLRFTQAYSACTVCSPTRASLLTGRNPAALRLTDWIPGHVRPNAKLKIPDWTQQLKIGETTLPALLKKAGYATASIGKWHLGPAGPTEHGFDLNIGGTEKGQPGTYFSPYKNPTLPDGPDGEFLTDRLTTEAEKFIEANQDHPFFLYLPHYAVHTPLMGKPEIVEKYKAKASPGDPQHNPTYAALVESVDDSVGRLRAKLAALGLAEKTVIVFTSDNGGLILNQVTANLGLRAGKGSAYEGGVRVPLIYCWPGKIKPGEVAEPAITADHFYTLLDLASVPAVASGEYRSLAPVLLGKGGIEPRDLHWHYPHYHPGGATPYSALRSGDFKLVAFFEDSHLELYNLKDDPEEKINLVPANPAKAEELRGKLAAWWMEMHAQMPAANPDYDPARETERAKPAKAK